MFENLLEQLNSSIISLGGKQVKVTNGMDICYSKKQASVIKSWLWDVPGFRRWRVTRMDGGEKLQVLNSVAYPAYFTDQPILGIDIIWFAIKKKLVAVLDFQPLIQDDTYFSRYYRELEKIKNRLEDFNTKQKMHVYDSSQYFSPWVLFYNGYAENLDEFLPLIFSDFLQAYSNISNINEADEYIKLNPSEVKRLQINYDQYNIERDPAYPLFRSYFGAEWADKFVHNFLFPGAEIS